VVRWVLVGRRDGLRAWVRSRLGLFTFLDRERSSAPPPPPAPAPAAAPPAVEEPGQGWLRVADASEVGPGEVLEVLAGDRPIALANVDGTVYAVDGTCPHAGGPLGDGHLEGAVLTCPWHGWSWDVKSGRSLVDETARVPTVPVRVVGGAVWVDPR
jgi:nitrite reductase/ring-hydroxylating ferredoxin subunit